MLLGESPSLDGTIEETNLVEFQSGQIVELDEPQPRRVIEPLHVEQFVGVDLQELAAFFALRPVVGVLRASMAGCRVGLDLVTLQALEAGEVFPGALLLVGIGLWARNLVRVELSILRFDFADESGAIQIGSEGPGKTLAYPFFVEAPRKSWLSAAILNFNGMTGNHSDLLAGPHNCPLVSTPSTDWISES